MEAIVDIVAFRSSKAKFIVKELTIVDVQTGSVSWFLFKPPCAAKDSAASSLPENTWLTNNFHGLLWEEGHVSYERLKDILASHLDSYNIVYVKGKEKGEFLQKRTTAKVMDLHNLGCPSLRRPNFWVLTPRYTCLRHKGTSYVCSRDQALKLYSWFICNNYIQ